jgi:hypothetical protein
VILQHGVEMTHFWRLLYQAAQRKLIAVELLVKHGANVEARDYDENTPLHLAPAKGKTDVVTFLVERWPGGKEALNVHGKTPLWMFEMGLWRKYQLRDQEKRRLLLCWAACSLRPIRIEGTSYCLERGTFEQCLCSVQRWFQPLCGHGIRDRAITGPVFFLQRMSDFR